MLNILYTNACISCLIWIHQMGISNALGDPYGSLLTWNILWFHLLCRKITKKNEHLKSWAHSSYSSMLFHSLRLEVKTETTFNRKHLPDLQSLAVVLNQSLQESKEMQPALGTNAAARIKCPRCLPLAQLPLCWHRHLMNKCLWSQGGNFHPIWCSSTAMAVKQRSRGCLAQITSPMELSCCTIPLPCCTFSKDQPLRQVCTNSSGQERKCVALNKCHKTESHVCLLFWSHCLASLWLYAVHQNTLLSLRLRGEIE